MYYANQLATFDLTRLDPGWVRYVNMAGLDQAARSRFGLGVAGYRMLSPFKTTRVRDDAPDHIKAAAEVAKSIATAAPNWDIHPATRSVAFLTRYGAINDNCGNLMLEAFTQEQLTELAASKQIFSIPVKKSHVNNYQHWTANMAYVENPANNIF